MSAPMPGALLGMTSPATCWRANARRQKNAGDKVRGSCILVVRLERKQMYVVGWEVF